MLLINHLINKLNNEKNVIFTGLTKIPLIKHLRNSFAVLFWAQWTIRGKKWKGVLLNINKKTILKKYYAFLNKNKTCRQYH